MDAPLRLVKEGLVHVYTGDGKGKTTAALGAALRGIGHGFKVYIVQFLKGGGYTGELVAAENYLPNIKIEQFGKGCINQAKQLKIGEFGIDAEQFNHVRDMKLCGECRYCFSDREEELKQSSCALARSIEAASSGEFDLVVLDQINDAMSKKLISVDDVLAMINGKHPNTELILTGRGAPQEIINAADLVTEMKEIKHPFSKGVAARPGIEY